MFGPSLKDTQRKALEHFITLSGNQRLNEGEINDYMKTFSAYLCKKDDAYYYNYSFLVQQNREFQEFLDKAAAKREVLTDFASKLKQVTQFKELMEHGDSANSVEVYMNELWKIDAASEKCSLMEDFSVSGAVCGQSDDIITLRYKDRTFSFSPKVDVKYLEQIVAGLLNTAAGREDSNE